MPTLIFTYSPVDGVSMEDFQKFLDEKDAPATLSYTSALSIKKFQILNEDAEFKVIELLEVTSLEDWDKESKNPSPEVQKVLDMWPKFGKVDEMKIYRCEDY